MKQKNMKQGKHDSENISTVTVVLLVVVAALLLYNQYLISSFTPDSSIGSGVAKLATMPKNTKGTVIGPVFNADGKTTSLKELPTISETPSEKSSDDVVQNALDMYVPTGKPWYGDALGVSFEDPIGSLTKLAQYDTKEQLTPEQKIRYDKLSYGFSCDYCCGGPNQVTHISNCGCQHAAAWRGVFKFFIKNYPEYTDEQLLGEATRWKVLFYPGPSIKRIVTDGSTGGVQAGQLDSLPGMVGGC